MSKKKSGFTLVELSIVLVIVGLLTGGILVARSMIGAAKLQSSVKAIQEIDIAIQNFHTRYNSLPGDSTTFGGDGDGILGTAYIGHGWGGGYNTEIENFWPSLSQSGFAPSGGNFSATIPGSGYNSDKNNLNAPQISIGNKTSVIVQATLGAVGAGYDPAPNMMDFGPWSGSTPGSDSNREAGFTVDELASIDKKIDDGHPFKGSVVNGWSGFIGDSMVPGCTDWADHYNTNNAKYQFGSSARNCFMSIGIMGETIKFIIGYV